MRIGKVKADKVLGNLGRIKNIKILEDWSFICAGELLNISRNIVPFDTGDLAKSGGVKQTKNGHLTFYGNDQTRYAKKQHEINYRHKNGRQWKYLEQPLYQNISKWKKFQKELFLKNIKDSIK
jgi:hypothetical protein